jgi:hypothetical protein
LASPEAAGPVVALYNGTVLVDRTVLVDHTNAEVRASLGVDIRPTQRTYDVATKATSTCALYGLSVRNRLQGLLRYLLFVTER